MTAEGAQASESKDRSETLFREVAPGPPRTQISYLKFHPVMVGSKKGFRDELNEYTASIPGLIHRELFAEYSIVVFLNIAY